MRRFFLALSIVSTCTLMVQWYHYTVKDYPAVVSNMDNNPQVKLMTVTCGDRLNLTLANLKSIVAFSRSRLHFYLYADAANLQPLRNELSRWPVGIRDRVSYDLRPVGSPVEGSQRWSKYFLRCSGERIFLPSMLREEDAVLYMDADVVFLRPVEELWKYLDSMDGRQMVAATPHTESRKYSWFSKYGTLPFVRPFGLNVGVMLLNLTRLREFGWEPLLVSLMKRHEGNFSGDQGLINLALHDQRDRLLVLPCKWNFRRITGYNQTTCGGETAAVIHGSGNSFTESGKEPAFMAIFQAMTQYPLGTSLVRNFIDPLELRLHQVKRTVCARRFIRQFGDWRQLAQEQDDYYGASS